MRSTNERNSRGSEPQILSISGQLEPWAAALETELYVLLASHRTKGALGKPARPGVSGAFVLTAELTEELRGLLRSGEIEVQAVRDQSGEIIGREQLRATGEHPSIGVTVKMDPGDLLKFFQPAPRASFDIFPSSAIRSLAGRVASLQGVDTRRAQAPKGVMGAIQELNAIANLAALTRAGDANAEKAFRSTLSRGALEKPGGAPPGLTGSLASTIAGVLENGIPGRGCGGTLAAARDVVETGFRLDMLDGNKKPLWTRHARAYVRDRMRMAGSYVGSVERAVREPGGPGGVPGGEPGLPGLDGLMDPILESDGPGGGVTDPPDDPGSGLGTIDCEMLTEICIDQFEATVAASLLDEWVKRIGAIHLGQVGNPACLCQSDLVNNPNQNFIATLAPEAESDFGPSRPAGVNLHLSSLRVDINMFIQSWAPEEIVFRLPPDARSGFVYLRAMAPRPSHESEQLARVCGKIAPDIPDVILFDNAPQAYISIVYPPVIESVTAGSLVSPPFEFEACTDVAICWNAYLQGEEGKSLPTCGEIQVEVRDANGQVVASGPQAHCGNARLPDDHTYTVQATSLAGGSGCGVSNQQTITITRYRAVHLEGLQAPANNPIGFPILESTEAMIGIRVSCPAGEGGIQVDLTSDNPAVLRVDSPVIIAAGATTAQARVVALGECLAATITAAANNHRPASAVFDVHVQPVLQGATPPPDLRIGDTAVWVVNTVCVPDHPDVEWWQVRVDANGQPLANVQPIRLARPVPAAANQFEVQLQGTAIGDWHLQVTIPFRNSIQSAGLAFVVGAVPSFALTLSPATRDVVWGQSANYDVRVEGVNLDANPLLVDLTVSNLPDGAQAQFPNNQNLAQMRVRLVQNDSDQHHPLNIATAHAATALGQKEFQVKGSSQGRAPIPQRTKIVVRRSTGAFTRGDVVRPTSQQGAIFTRPCGNLVRAEFSGFRVTFFTSVTGSEEHTQAVSAVFFLLSPNCRVGVALAGQPGFGASWYNLGFPAAPIGIARQVTSEPSTLWRQFWFSPDDSLMLMVEDATGGNPPLTHNFRATLYDCTRDHEFDDDNFAARYDVLSGGPEGLAVPMPRFTTIVLEPSGDVVTLKYETDFEGGTGQTELQVN